MWTLKASARVSGLFFFIIYAGKFFTFATLRLFDWLIQVMSHEFLGIFLTGGLNSVLWIRNYFFQIRIRLLRKFRIRIRPNLSLRRQKKFFETKLQHKSTRFWSLPVKCFDLKVNLKVPIQRVLSRYHNILVSENWSLSDLDPKLIIPDPANNIGSDMDPDPQHWLNTWI